MAGFQQHVGQHLAHRDIHLGRSHLVLQVGGSPKLAVRKMLRFLRGWDQWKVADLEAVAALAPGTGDALVKALRTEGLIEASARGAWSVTQAGRTFSAASAAKPVTKATAENALAEFLDRVEQVNRDPYFLGKDPIPVRIS
jgi:hypothetical protein